MPQYRLQVLLDLRERAKKMAEEAFAEATQVLADEKVRLEEERTLMQEMIEDRHERRAEYARKLTTGEMRVTDQSNAYKFIERLKEREADQQIVVDGQQEQVREAEKEMRLRQQELIEAARDHEALVKHRDKWLEEVKRERMMKEEDAMDEIGQTIFQQRLRSGDCF